MTTQPGFYSNPLHKIVIAAVFFICICFSGCFVSEQEKVCFQDNCFNVELVATPGERAKGLMFRRSLGYKQGMLFVFEDESIHSFWMKNTFIPLDIIWLNIDWGG